MKLKYQDMIDDYLLDRMTDEERSLFEVETSYDEELQEQLKFTEDIQKAITNQNN